MSGPIGRGVPTSTPVERTRIPEQLAGAPAIGTSIPFWPGVAYGRDGASVIQDGRVVATDDAPDVGWLDPSAEAKP